MENTLKARSLWSLENIPTPSTALYLIAELERLYHLGVCAVAIDGDALARREARRRRSEAMAAHPSNLR